MQTLNILHIATDNKFLDYALPLFKQASAVENTVWVINQTRYLGFTQSPVDRVISPDELPSVNASGHHAIVLHSYKDYLANFLLKLPADKPILWIGWGFDYYDLIDPSAESLWLAQTRAFDRARQSQQPWLKRLVRALRAKMQRDEARLKEQAIQRINYFAPVLPIEYRVLQAARPDLSLPEQIDWNYGTLEDQYALNLGEDWVSGDHILIGNSATLTSNHLDALGLVAEAGLSKHQKVYMPLNYGDAHPEYTSAVCKRAQHLLGGKSEPITDFMPLEVYLELLSQCGFVIMNHVRQQALGNIISMLYLGSRIFLREESPVYKDLSAYGFALNTVQQLDSNPEHLRTPLSIEERENNRQLCRQRWGREAALERTQQLIATLRTAAARP